jgi:hypothetical protein
MFPSELVVAKTKLESEGIECRVLNELTVQSYNFLSNAVGGVKLQVPIADFDKAHTILKQGGFINEEKDNQLSYLERKLSNPRVYRITKNSFIAISIIIVLFIISFFINLYINKPSDYERLIGRNWCLDHVVYQDEVFYPYTLSDKLRVHIIGQCEELLIFDSSGIVQFPGFNTTTFNHNWFMTNNQIIISNIDTIESVFYGNYNYDLSRNELIMISDSLEIVCVRP